MLRFELLGDVRGWRDHAQLNLGPPQRRAVLVDLLLRSGAPASAPELVHDLWGEDPPPRAVAMIRNHVVKLRRVLEPDRAPRNPATVLVSAGDGYALRLPPDAVDVGVAQDLIHSAAEARRLGSLPDARANLVAALELWQGTPLSCVPGPHATRHRTHLSEYRLDLLEQLYDVELELGRGADIVADLAALADDHPLRERLRGLLMLALQQCGRQAEALQVYERTRRTLVAELGIEPGAELVTIHNAILRGTVDTPPHDGGAAGVAEHPRPSVVPAQLPADLPDFVGRECLADALVDHLAATDGAVAISAVGGMGGIGKSSLALHVAHRVRGRFPGGQFYVNLRSVDAMPADPLDVLGGFLRALNVAEGDIPATVEQRAAQFRTMVCDKRMLIVLDNALDTAQVTPLLPGTAGTAVLITSRNNLTELAGVTSTRLDVLDSDAAVAMLTGIVGTARIEAERTAARKIVEACGHLPLAVRIIGARLAARPGWSLASIVPRLQDESVRLDTLRTGELTVAAAFRLGIRELSDGQARAFAMLAVPESHDISIDGAATILDTTPESAEAVAESLVDLSLLDSTEPGRYRYHDLLRLYARSLAGDDPAPLHRLLDFYLATMKNMLIGAARPHFAKVLAETESEGVRFVSNEAGARWRNNERANFLAVYEHAASVGGHAATLASDIAYAMVALLEIGVRADELARALRLLLATAQRECDSVTVDRIEAALGFTQCIGLGETANGLATLNSVAARAAADQPRLVALIENVLVSSARELADHKASIRHAEHAIRLNREIGDRSQEATAFANLSVTLCELGRHDAATAAAQQALDMGTEMSIGEIQAWALHELGHIAMSRGDLRRAHELCTEAVRFANTSGTRVREGRALTRLAQVHLYCSEFDRAETLSAQAVSVMTQFNAPSYRGHALLVHGLALQGLHRFGEAHVAYSEARVIYDRAGSPTAQFVQSMIEGLNHASPTP